MELAGPTALGWPAWLTLAVVVVTVLAMIRDWVSPAVAVFGADVVLLVAGVTTAQQAFSGFSNPAPITVAALFVVARAVEKTGALQPLVRGVLGASDADVGDDGDGGDPGESGPPTPRTNGDRRRLSRLLLPTAASSAVLNNTPVVAMLAPQVADWAQKRGRSASRYLMPLSFATILGGTLTLVGTSTNLVVAGLMQETGLEPLGMFELTRVGLPIAVVGIVLILVLAPRLVPERRPPRRQFEEDVREYVIQQRVAPGGPLDGLTVDDAKLRHLEGVFLAEIEREGEKVAPVAPSTVLHSDDRLIFVGRVDMVRDLQQIPGLLPEEQKHAEAFSDSSHTFFEAVVSPASSLVGQTLKDVDFRSQYQAAVMAIHRAGERVNAKLGEVSLKEGDTLLVLSDPGFGDRWRHRSEFLLVSYLGGSPPPPARQAYFVGAVMLGVVFVAGLFGVPILHTALVGSILLVVGGAITPAEARDSLELDTLVVIAASFGVGAAIQASGLGAAVGHLVVAGFAGAGPIGVLLGLTIATLLLTELITNNAAAVLLFPVALAAAAELGVDPRPFLIALTVAASASFLTPIGYQTNTMVYGLGGYRFTDYARLGTPLTLVVILTILVAVPLFWPF
jgi:di/tricarboxylate transporter